MTKKTTARKLSKARHVELPPGEITIIDGRNYRQGFDKPSLLGLRSSMDDLGQLQEIIVNETAGGRMELVAGERRLKAAQAAGLKLVECKVYPALTDMQMARVTSAENAERVDLNPIERAGSLARLSELGMRDKQVAAEANCSTDTVRRLRGLLELTDHVQRMVVRDKFPLPTHQAFMLGKLPLEKQTAMARIIAPKNGPVVGEREARGMIEAEVQKPLPGLAEPSKGKGKVAAEKPIATAEWDNFEPVGVVISIAGKLTEAKRGGPVIKSAAVTVKVGDKVEVLRQSQKIDQCVGMNMAVRMAIQQQAKPAKKAKAKPARKAKAKPARKAKGKPARKAKGKAARKGKAKPARKAKAKRAGKKGRGKKTGLKLWDGATAAAAGKKAKSKKSGSGRRGMIK